MKIRGIWLFLTSQVHQHGRRNLYLDIYQSACRAKISLQSMRLPITLHAEWQQRTHLFIRAFVSLDYCPHTRHIRIWRKRFACPKFHATNAYRSTTGPTCCFLKLLNCLWKFQHHFAQATDSLSGTYGKDRSFLCCPPRQLMSPVKGPLRDDWHWVVSTTLCCYSCFSPLIWPVQEMQVCLYSMCNEWTV